MEFSIWYTCSKQGNKQTKTGFLADGNMLVSLITETRALNRSSGGWGAKSYNIPQRLMFVFGEKLFMKRVNVITYLSHT